MQEYIQFCKKNPALIFIVIVYSGLTILSLNNCYFWDNIYYTPVFAYKFQTLFSSQNWTTFSLIFNDQFISSLGFYPPTMGFITALLWKIVGCHLWVSHTFYFAWFILLVYNLWKLLSKIMPSKFVGWTLLIILLEPTILTQYSIASPDFILFTSFIISLRAIIENKRKLLLAGIILLCGIHVRGLFVAAILLMVDYYNNYILLKNRANFRNIAKTTIPYLISFILIGVYLIIYLRAGGGLISTSAYSTHYEQPTAILMLRNIATFGLRSLENGRFLIWVIGLIMLLFIFKRKFSTSNYIKLVILFFVCHLGLYVLFIFITKMPFSHRYFMPHYFALTVIAILGIGNYLSEKKSIIVFVIIILTEITGNLWIYPEIMAKSWDCTLAHLPYYKLRNECFEYIDSSKIDYKDISAGFCLYGSRELIELRKNAKSISDSTTNKYFIYSNISNLNDSLILNLKNAKYWQPIRTFEKGFVNIVVYKRNCYVDTVATNRYNSHPTQSNN